MLMQCIKLAEQKGREWYHSWSVRKGLRKFGCHNHGTRLASGGEQSLCRKNICSPNAKSLLFEKPCVSVFTPGQSFPCTLASFSSVMKNRFTSASHSAQHPREEPSPMQDSQPVSLERAWWWFSQKVSSCEWDSLIALLLCCAVLSLC